MADTCASLAAEIAALRAEIARIPKVDENALKRSIKSSLEPDITTAVAAGVAILANKLDPQIKNLINGITDANKRIGTTERIAGEAKAASDAIARQKYASLSALENEIRLREYGDNLTKQGYSKAQVDALLTDERLAASLREAKGQQALQSEYKNLVRAEQTRASAAEVGATNKAVDALEEAAKASKNALNTAQDVTGLKGVVNGVKGTLGKLGDSVVAVEKSVGNAVTQAAKAIGISGEALGATARLGGKVLEIFNVIGTIFVILDGLATRELLGARIDALEAGQAALGRDISKALGYIFELVNKVRGNELKIVDVELLARDAKSIGLRATELSKQAQFVAERATTKAEQAQTTADGAVRNSKIANDNATIAYNKANESISIAERAIITANNSAASANNKADLAIGEARVALNKAEQGINSANGSNVKAERAINEAQAIAKKAQTALNKAEQSEKSVNSLSGKVSGLETKVNVLNAVIPPLNLTINNTTNIANTANTTANIALDEAQNKGDSTNLKRELDQKFNNFVAKNNNDLNIRGLATSDLSKQFNENLANFERLSKADANTRFNEFVAKNKNDLNIRDLTTSDLSKQFNENLANFKRLSTADANVRFNEFVTQNERDLGVTNTKVGALEKTIPQIQTQQRENEKLNREGLDKLNLIIPAIGGIALIPALTANAIRPAIPTLPQIETAAAAGTCRTTRPGGCMSKALGDNATNINNNTNNKVGNILDGINTGANAALLAGQQTILGRLGAQLPGGIGGKLSRFADWMHLDRVLNVMIFGATIHNGLMLSNDIGQTFFGIINNVLQLVGLKKEDGSTFDIGSVISSSIENLIKEAIGAENYINLTTAWSKANRIYQASTNILNSFQSLTSTVLNGLELVAGQTGKIGNALKASGEVLESAYQWMNPQPKINRVTNFLQGLQNGASTIQQVTQVPLDTINAVTELQTANTDFIKAIKEDDKPANKAPAIPEPDKLAADKETAKIASKGLELLGIDLEADDD